jgi:hypothetical protein
MKKSGKPSQFLFWDSSNKDRNPSPIPLMTLQSKILNPLDAMPACRKCSIVGGRYAILRKELFFSKKFTNCGARPGKGRVSKTTPLLGDIPRLMSGQADQKLAPFAAGVEPPTGWNPELL